MNYLNLTDFCFEIRKVLGALTPMPAVKIFSLYAALAVFIDFVLQITCFVSLMTLDCRRELSKRYDFVCCIRSQLDDQVEKEDDEEEIIETDPINNICRQPRDFGQKPNYGSFNESIETESSALVGQGIRKRKKEKSSGLLFGLFKEYYAPFLMNKAVRPLVIVFFLALLFTSLSLLPQVSSGLDQKLSMPRDSYVLDYFEALGKYLSVGVPVYIVVKSGHNYSLVENQNMICSTSGCNSDSLLNQINQATLQSNYTKLAIPANSWIDDYFDWLSSGDCCRVFAN